jgi:endonuclease/exonuclease/phosphatase family metal-dependent hydrolase
VTLRIATFNVKDLFCNGRGESEATAGGSALYRAKVQFIAAEIRRSNVQIVGLQEIGGPLALAGLAEALPEFSATMGTVDDRGIGCAILSRQTIVRAEVHVTDELPFPVFLEGDAAPFRGRIPLRRGIVEIEIGSSLGNISVFCTHMKSNLPRKLRRRDGTDEALADGASRGAAHVRSAVLRAAEALYLRGLVDGSKSMHQVVLGDFNDDARSLVIKVLTGDRESTSGLFSAINHVPEHRRWTTLYGGRPQCIDHILTTPALRDTIAAADIQNDALTQHRPPVDGEPETIDSDHALYWMEIGIEAPAP